MVSNNLWIAKDKDNTLGLYNVKPTRDEHYNEWTCDNNWLLLNDNDFISGKYHNISWNDDPIECVVVTREEYQKIMGELLDYKVKEMNNLTCEQTITKFKEWIYSDECDGRLHAIRDKIEELKL